MKTHDELAAHMRETLVPDPPTVSAAASLLEAGMGLLNRPGQTIVFSTLHIAKNGNRAVESWWTGKETVSDPGAVYVDRAMAWKANRAAQSEEIATAVVYHTGPGEWSVYIDHPSA